MVIIKGEASVGNRLKRFELLGHAAGLGLVVALVTITSSLLLGSTQSFSVPDDVALRIRLDDTLTSTDSEVGDPFSATVVDQGDYQNARVYGHITQIDMSGKIKGRYLHDAPVRPVGDARRGVGRLFTPKLWSFITRLLMRR